MGTCAIRGRTDHFWQKGQALWPANRSQQGEPALGAVGHQASGSRGQRALDAAGGSGRLSWAPPKGC